MSSDSVVDDKDRSLHEIIQSDPNKSLISRLIEIQKSSVEQKKSRRFIENLLCLRYEKSAEHVSQFVLLRKTEIDAFDRRDQSFVALSYTWAPSPRYETATASGNYRVQERYPSVPVPSQVRDSVFRRVLAYMRYLDVTHLWIDQHCIEQEPGEEKEMGMQAMDLVYSQSKYPVALLARPIQSEDELQLLLRVLRGDFIKTNPGSRVEFTSSITLSQASLAMQLLEDITDDLWWRRGWTFQEKYRARKNMQLLMPVKILDYPRRRGEEVLCGRHESVLLKYLSDELCVSSSAFHRETTRFCLAYQKKRPDTDTKKLCRTVIQMAGDYDTILEEESRQTRESSLRSISPRIFEDINRRELKMPWDRIAIAANCCQYSIRLDSEKLKKKLGSISLSMLALFLINGELLSNCRLQPDDNHNPWSSTIAQVIHLQSYQEIHLPDGTEDLKLSCRLLPPRLTMQGVVTEGYLWKIKRCLDTTRFLDTPLPWEEQSQFGLALNKRRRLRQLANYLAYEGEKDLANRLVDFLLADHKPTFAQAWQNIMAENIVLAIEGEQPLGIAYQVSGSSRSRGGAVFIMRDSQASRRLKRNPHYIFTSSWEEDSCREYDFNDVDRNVSLRVDCPNPNGRIPQLFTREWVYGLCLFHGSPPSRVVFPWPRWMRDM